MIIFRAKAARIFLRVRRFLSGQSGQGMTEYASITTILLLGGLAGGAGWPYFKMLIEGFDRYLASIYFTLNLALP